MSPAKCSTASACNNPSDNITEIRYFGTVRLLRPKQNKVLYVNMEYMDLLPPTAPSLVFARETCTPYSHCTIALPLAKLWVTKLDSTLLLFRYASSEILCREMPYCVHRYCDNIVFIDCIVFFIYECLSSKHCQYYKKSTHYMNVHILYMFDYTYFCVYKTFFESYELSMLIHYFFYAFTVA